MGGLFMLKQLKNYIKGDATSTKLFFGLDERDWQEVDRSLKEPDEFINIVIDFNDLKYLDSLICSVPEDIHKDLIVYYIYEQYFYYQILKHFDQDVILENFGDNHVKHMEEALFSGLLEKFEALYFVDLMEFDHILALFNEKTGTRIKLHLMLDKVDIITLQMVINMLIAARSAMGIMGYSSSNNLITYSLNTGHQLQKEADYFAFHGENPNASRNRKPPVEG